MEEKALKYYSAREERANTISHALGIVFVVVSSVVLIRKAVLTADVWAVVSYVIMALGILSSYVSSTVYHALPHSPQKFYWRRADHATIYLNIAGSYTPFTLFLLHDKGAWGWSLFGVVWVSAFLGVGLNFLKMKRANHIKTLSYLAMGWVIVIAAKPLIEVLGVQGKIEALYWLVAEGVFFTVGALIYMFAKREFMHSVWHLFVLMGTICHTVSAYKIL